MAILFTMNVSAQKTIANNSNTLPPQQINQIQAQLVDGMVSFVESVRPFYKRGDTYAQFKLKVLLGDQAVASKTALPTLPREGEAMLRKAYEYLSKGYNSATVAAKDNGKTIGQATLFLHNFKKITEGQGLEQKLLYLEVMKRYWRIILLQIHPENHVNGGNQSVIFKIFLEMKEELLLLMQSLKLLKRF